MMHVKKAFRSGCDAAGKCECAERMWVRVEHVKKDGILVGKLDNKPFCSPMKVGDRVEITPEEITNLMIGDRNFVDVELYEALPAPTRARTNWTGIVAAALAGVTLTTLITGYARRA